MRIIKRMQNETRPSSSDEIRKHSVEVEFLIPYAIEKLGVCEEIINMEMFRLARCGEIYSPRWGYVKVPFY